jgi:hypothetical protein
VHCRGEASTQEPRRRIGTETRAALSIRFRPLYYSLAALIKPS